MDNQFKQNAIKFREYFAELDTIIKEQNENPIKDKNYAEEIRKIKLKIAEMSIKLHNKST